MGLWTAGPTLLGGRTRTSAPAMMGAIYCQGSTDLAVLAQLQRVGKLAEVVVDPKR